MDYIISDLHLDHDNIIEYCHRPFETVDEMNETLVNNWNSTIDPADEVLFGGDLTIRSSAAVVLDWIETLNGEMVFLIGNHDTTIFEQLDSVSFVDHYSFTYRDIPFTVVHDPADGPGNPTGWVLHGHHHNNWPERFPFIDHDNQRVNFSVELINFRPLALDRLVEYIACGEQFADRSAAESYLQNGD